MKQSAKKLLSGRADVAKAQSRMARWNSTVSGESVPSLRKELQRSMQSAFGIFRRGDDMDAGVVKVNELRERIAQAHLGDKTSSVNTARVEALELDNLLETAEATAMSAQVRTESRGAHSREDYPDRDDENWLAHSLFNTETKSVSKRAVNFAPKQVKAFQPKARTY